MQKQVNFSHWEKSVFFEEVDVAIIGAGIVGVNAAIHLKELRPNWKIMLLERGIFPLGASTRNAGFACFGSMTELLDDLRTQSEAEVFGLVEKRWKGLLKLRSRVGEQYMDYQSFGAYELFRPETRDFAACVEQLESFNKTLSSIIGEPSVFEKRTKYIEQFGFEGISQLIYNRSEGQLNPGKMMQRLWAIARQLGIDIYTGVEVTDYEQLSQGLNIKTNQGIIIKASNLLVATNGFTKKLLPQLEVLPARNQVLITKPLDKIPFKACFHFDKGYFYFRNVGNRILLGGGRNLARAEEETDEFGFSPIIQDALVDLLDTVILPGQTYEIDRWWSGILGVGDQKKPIVNQIEERVFVAVRLGGMGVAIGTLVGEEAAELIINT